MPVFYLALTQAYTNACPPILPCISQEPLPLSYVCVLYNAHQGTTNNVHQLRVMGVSKSGSRYVCVCVKVRGRPRHACQCLLLWYLLNSALLNGPQHYRGPCVEIHNGGGSAEGCSLCVCICEGC